MLPLSLVHRLITVLSYQAGIDESIILFFFEYRLFPTWLHLYMALLVMSSAAEILTGGFFEGSGSADDRKGVVVQGIGFFGELTGSDGTMVRRLWQGGGQLMRQGGSYRFKSI